MYVTSVNLIHKDIRKKNCGHLKSDELDKWRPIFVSSRMTFIKRRQEGQTFPCLVHTYLMYAFNITFEKKLCTSRARQGDPRSSIHSSHFHLTSGRVSSIIYYIHYHYLYHYYYNKRHILINNYTYHKIYRDTGVKAIRHDARIEIAH